MNPSVLDSTGVVTEAYLVSNNLVPGDIEAGGGGAGLGKSYGTVLDPKPYPVQPQSPHRMMSANGQQVIYNQQRQMVQTQTSTTGLPEAAAAAPVPGRGHTGSSAARMALTENPNHLNAEATEMTVIQQRQQPPTASAASPDLAHMTMIGSEL